MSCPAGVLFDGTNDYLTCSPFTGLSDGFQGSISFWTRITVGGGTSGYFLANDLENFRIQIANQRALIDTWDDTHTDQHSFQSSGATLPEGGGWVSVLASWDNNFGAGSKLRHLYINDVSDVASFNDTAGAFSVGYATGVTGWGLGARFAGTGKISADIAAMWFTPTYIDFSITANRRKFITAMPAGVDLGPTGAIPTGSQPILYVDGPAAGFQNNLGSGGGFSVTGALTDSSSNPACAVTPPTLMGGSAM